MLLDDFSPEAIEKLSGTVNSELNPVKYLSIDPGKSNGVCGYDSKYYLQFMYTIPAEHMMKFMHTFVSIDTCIVEDFILYPQSKLNKRDTPVYSDMETSRVIGRIESWTELGNITLIKQPATIKKTGYLWIGEKPLPKSNPRNHELDAHVHFMYWGIKTGRISAKQVLNK